MSRWLLYTWSMDVGVTELRSHLGEWLSVARSGEGVVVTERGIPIARLLRVDATAALERLTNEGVIAKPEQPRRPHAVGRL